MPDTLTAAHQHLTNAVAALVTGDDWQRMLAVATRFHHYSAGNVMLITAQRPDATHVAGYRTWQRLGRNVRRGEHGIAILAPCTYRRPADTTGDDDAAAAVLRGFRIIHVFDIAQTDGEPLPDVAPALLTGDDPTGLYDRLAGQIFAAGFELRRGNCRPANGVTDYATRTVTIGDDLAPAQAAKTLAHELGHVLLHDGTEYATGCRGRAEVEAESVAYLIGAAAGLDTGGYSFAYIAHWSGGDPAAVHATAARVIDAARRAIGAAGLTATADPAQVTAA